MSLWSAIRRRWWSWLPLQRGDRYVRTTHVDGIGTIKLADFNVLRVSPGGVVVMVTTEKLLHRPASCTTTTVSPRAWRRAIVALQLTRVHP